MLNIWASCSSRFTLATPSPSDMPAWYLLQLDPWQLSLKYSNSATELSSDSVPQLVRAWQAICQFAGSSPSLSHCQFLFPLYFSLYFFLSLWVWLSLRSDCQVWSMLIFECHAPHASRSPHPLLPQSKSLSYASVWMFALIASHMSSSRMKSVLFICGAWLSC